MQNSLGIEFPNGRGERLAGRLELPIGEPVTYALFAHCFTCSKDIIAAGRISRALCAEGIAVLRFDFTGLGNSEGDFANENFTSNVDDLVAAADYMRDHHGPPELLVGHSLGGAAVVVATARIPETRAVATIGAPSDPEHVRHLLRDGMKNIDETGAAEVKIAGRSFRISRQFVEDLAAQNVARALREFDGAVAVLHSPVDETVGLENARYLFDAARHPKSFISLDDADHLLRRKRDAEYAARVLAAWASRYVETGGVAEKTPPSREGQVVVSEAGPRYGTAIVAGGHALVADEPATVGGGDTGPTPYDLLLAALGACTTMTLRMYADRKQWPVEHLAASLSHEKIHARDCETCDEGTKGRVDRIDRVLHLTGPLDEEQRQRLLEIADRCPVHRTLEGEKEIRTRLAAE